MFRVRVREERLNHAAPTAHHILDRGKIALRDTAALLRVPEEVAQVEQELVARILPISHAPSTYLGLGPDQT